MRIVAPVALVSLCLGAACSGGDPPAGRVRAPAAGPEGPPGAGPGAAGPGPGESGGSGRPDSSDAVFGPPPGAARPYDANDVFGSGGGTSVAVADGTSCPAGMKMVEGEYCTDVEQVCLRSWFDKSNKKTVCEEFKSPSVCKGEKVKKRYCIDTFEWPNKKGERPEVMNTFHQAQVKCAAAGKRLCTETEWTFACEGPEMKPFPHGFVRDAKKCNGDHNWDGPNMKLVAKRDPTELARLWKGVPSGSQPECVSDFGVADMPGNADEVSSSETMTSDWKGKFDSVNTGGPWYKGVRNQCRPKIYTHDEGFYYYFLSFRCCAEPDGKTTDPRTPKQRKAGWKFSRVEATAGFSLAKMKEKLELKEKGSCNCGLKDIMCKTMCGTLLGPGAVDAKH
jgi:formylglycine-generating enzyme